jgi:FHA domain-containing protein/zinc ribbon protein
MSWREFSMIACERCGTQNLDGSRYCDECGAALWLAGKSGDRPAAQGNGSEGHSNREVSATVVRAANPLPAGGSGVPPVNHAQDARATSAVSQPQSSGPDVVGDGSAHATLVIERGSSAGKQFPLSHEDSNIGRWDADGGVFPDVDLDTDDPEAKVSRRHARISFRDGQYAIEDLGSTNGTFVNRGRRLRPGDRQSLKDGDEIIVGKTFLRFRVAKK